MSDQGNNSNEESWELGRSFLAGEFAGAPLDPMPRASLDETAAWLRKLSVGAAISLATTGLIVAMLLLRQSAPAAGSAVAVVLDPAMAVANAVAVWLITISEPGRITRLRTLRTIARIGAIAGVFGVPLSQTPGGLYGADWLNSKYFAIAGWVLGLVSLASQVFLLHYLEFLAGRLRDNFLRVVFLSVKWFLAVLLGLSLFALPTVLSQTERVGEKRPPASTPLPLFLLILALMLAVAYIIWRFYGRLRNAAAAAAELAGRGGPGATFGA